MRSESARTPRPATVWRATVGEGSGLAEMISVVRRVPLWCYVALFSLWHVALALHTEFAAVDAAHEVEDRWAAWRPTACEEQRAATDAAFVRLCRDATATDSAGADAAVAAARATRALAARFGCNATVLVLAALARGGYAGGWPSDRTDAVVAAAALAAIDTLVGPCADHPRAWAALANAAQYNRRSEEASGAATGALASTFAHDPRACEVLSALEVSSAAAVLGALATSAATWCALPCGGHVFSRLFRPHYGVPAPAAWAAIVPPCVAAHPAAVANALGACVRPGRGRGDEKLARAALAALTGTPLRGTDLALAALGAAAAEVSQDAFD